LRLAVAALFALLNLLQLPAMAFAWAGTVVPPQPAALVSSHHQHEAHNHRHSPNMTDVQDVTDVQNMAGDIYRVPPCYSVACCTGLAAPGVEVLAASDLPLGPLDVAAPTILVPAFLDPADPPPRLRA
jgi:hypothetical protein